MNQDIAYQTFHENFLTCKRYSPPFEAGSNLYDILKLKISYEEKYRQCLFQRS